MNQYKQNIINEIYEFAVNSTFEKLHIDGQLISLVHIRDLALDGGYENDEQAYKAMIQNELEITEIQNDNNEPADLFDKLHEKLNEEE